MFKNFSLSLLMMFTAILCFPMQLFAEADSAIQSTPAKFRLTYDTIRLPKNEDMGFLGGNFLYDTNDWLSVGWGFYGALVGQRGGFITMGGTAEVHMPVTDAVELNSGIFVGAGGGRGGFHLSGGGLMLRYHAGASYKTDNFGNFGVGLSYLDFPDGTIHSTQPYVSYEYPFTTLILSGWDDVEPQESSTMGKKLLAEQEIAPLFRSYFIPNGTLTDSGAVQSSRINLMGAEWNRYIDDHLFLHMEVGGAMGGKSAGFMQLLLGGGYRQSLWDGAWLKLSASAGVAGGGAVNAGGGFLVDGIVSLQQQLSDHFYAELSGGYVLVPETGFKALSMAAKVGYHISMPDVQGESVLLSDVADFDVMHFRMRVAHHAYFKGAANWRSHHADLNVNNLGIQFDVFPHDNFYFTGQVFAAYSGKAGAYMNGLVGAGIHLPLFQSPLFFDAEIGVGPAGGGGMAVGGGFIWQSNAGFGYEITDNHSIIAQYGYMAAPMGNFKAKVFTVAFASKIGLLFR